MNIAIDIHYISVGNKVLQKGNFPLKRRKPEEVAYEFWKWIQKNNSHRAVIEKIICNGDQDITQLVVELEKQEWNKSMNDNLPF